MNRTFMDIHIRIVLEFVNQLLPHDFPAERLVYSRTGNGEWKIKKSYLVFSTLGFIPNTGMRTGVKVTATRMNDVVFTDDEDVYSDWAKGMVMDIVMPPDVFKAWEFICGSTL